MKDSLENVLEAARTAPAESLPELLGKLAVAQAVAFSRLQSPAPMPKLNDELLGIEETCRRLGVSTAYMYRHHAEFSFTRRVGKKLLFSSLGIEQHIKNGKLR